MKFMIKKNKCPQTDLGKYLIQGGNKFPYHIYRYLIFFIISIRKQDKTTKENINFSNACNIATTLSI